MNFKNGDCVILSDEGIQMLIEEYGDLSRFDTKKRVREVKAVFLEDDEISFMHNRKMIDVNSMYYRLASKQEIQKENMRNKIINIFHNIKDADYNVIQKRRYRYF